jgi:hypothetical protein
MAKGGKQHRGFAMTPLAQWDRAPNQGFGAFGFRTHPLLPRFASATMQTRHRVVGSEQGLLHSLWAVGVRHRLSADEWLMRQH